MGLFRRKNGGDNASAQSLTSPDGELNEKAQEVMKDNLELMKDIVMRIRDEPEFAQNIYRDCPRLQHLLDQYPDLRPIFEDPKLVRINFEQVYRDAGGVLPEDEKKKKSWLVWLVNSPVFKVLKVFLFVKKLMACITGGGFAFVSGCLLGCCFEDALEELDGDVDGDADADVDFDPAKEALNKAADHMEDPEIQEQMQALLDDPDNLQEAIENDPDLKALRDSNPLCEELMSDPETMRVLTDPDNLRALGEAPNLIEADFADPGGFVPDIETGGMDGLDGADYDLFDSGADAEFELETDFEGDDDFGDLEDDGGEGDGDGEGEEEEEEEGWWDDAEFEEQEAEGGDNNAQANKGQARSQAQKKQAQQQAQQAAGNNRTAGIMASVGVAATELLAAQIVGNVFGDGIIPGMGGGGDGGLGGLDGLGDTDVLDDAGIADVADDAGEIVDDDIAAVAEDTVDEVDENKDTDGKNQGEWDAETDVDGKGKKTGGVAAGAAAGGVAGGAALAAGGTSRGVAEGDEEGEDTFEDEEKEKEKPKRGRFAMLGSLAAATLSAAKEHVATAVLGDDFGEALVEKMEDDEEEDEEEGSDKDDDDSDKKNDDKKNGSKRFNDSKQGSRSSFFGRK
eukprot:Nitzschia sp. Nitz4//scaffold43_size134323//80257//82128//NITZ4_003308-RA/size134323-processed-gene-0.56-mRNA-1//-1//CDS//3329551975//1372//frame0